MHKWQRNLTEFIMFYTCIDKSFHIHIHHHCCHQLKMFWQPLVFFSGLAKIALKAYSWPFLIECAYHLVLTINGRGGFFASERHAFTEYVAGKGSHNEIKPQASAQGESKKKKKVCCDVTPTPTCEWCDKNTKWQSLNNDTITHISYWHILWV